MYYTEAVRLRTERKLCVVLQIFDLQQSWRTAYNALGKGDAALSRCIPLALAVIVMI